MYLDQIKFWVIKITVDKFSQAIKTPFPICPNDFLK